MATPEVAPGQYLLSYLREVHAARGGARAGKLVDAVGGWRWHIAGCGCTPLKRVAARGQARRRAWIGGDVPEVENRAADLFLED